MRKLPAENLGNYLQALFTLPHVSAEFYLQPLDSIYDRIKELMAFATAIWEITRSKLRNEHFSTKRDQKMVVDGSLETTWIYLSFKTNRVKKY